MDKPDLSYADPVSMGSALGCLACWLTAYVLIIRRGIVDRTYGMPLVPLCVNVSYEFMFGVVYPDQPPLNIINIVWFVFDLGIVWTYLRFGRREFPTLLPGWSFYPCFALVLSLSFAGVLAVTWQFNDRTGSFTGWGDAFLIPCAFLALLFRRGTAGQSIYIAILTLVGTLALIPLEMGISPGSPLLHFLYAGIALVGAAYVLLLFRALRLEGRDPWRVW